MKSIDLTDDGCHKFEKSDHHRHLLFMNLLKFTEHKAWASLRHNDGIIHKGWFIVGIHLPIGPITYYLPDQYWDVLTAICDNVEILEKSPKLDDHTYADVLVRLFDNIND